MAKRAPKVVEAAFCMVEDLSGNGARVQDAMFAALQRAQAQGVSDPETIKARMLAARDGVTDPIRTRAVDAAVRRTLSAWAITCPPRTLASEWERALPEEIVAVVQANFVALNGASDHERSRVYARDAGRHGGVPA